MPFVHFKDMKPDIFRPRTALKPLEYPDILKYKDAIRHSFWVHTEFNFTPDIQDMMVKMRPHEVEALNRTMLAISQIENAVKSFWGDVHKHLPKPEISDVGGTFAESEIRHKDAYAALLEKMGLDKRFEDIQNIPALQDRLDYIQKINTKTKTLGNDPKEYFRSIIFFSMLIEYVSLFSQFYIILAFNKHDNVLKGMSNAVEATSKEEDIHANFGFDLINIIKEENPEWFTPELQKYIQEKVIKAFIAEQKVLEWVYENGELKAAPKAVVEEFVKHRLNNALKAIGIEEVFSIDKSLAKSFEWFEDEITVTKNNDFFQKRSTNYTKKTKSINAEELF